MSERGYSPLQQSALAQAHFQIAHRRDQVAKLIAAKFTHRQIAEILGVSPGTVQADKDAIMKEWARSMMAEIGETFLADLAMLDQMQQRLAARVDEGDMNAMDMMLKVQKRRAAMMGLDAKDRLQSGLRVLPPEEVEAETEEVFTPDGRPVGKGDAARIYAAFASEDPEGTGQEPETCGDGGEPPTVG